MPFRNRVHNHLEIGSLVLNFVLFDTALLATSGGEGSIADNVAAVSLVLDLVRVAAFLALGGYGIYENRAGIFRFMCGSVKEEEGEEEKGEEEEEEVEQQEQDDEYRALASGAPGSD
jgi:hypothetical protein